MSPKTEKHLHSGPPIIIPLQPRSTSPPKDPRIIPEYGCIKLEYRRLGIFEISHEDWRVDLSQSTMRFSFDRSPASEDSGICIDYAETRIGKINDPRLHRPAVPATRVLINRTPGSKLKMKSESKLFLNTTLPNIGQPAIKKCPPMTNTDVVAVEVKKVDTETAFNRICCEKESVPKLFLEKMLSTDSRKPDVKNDAKHLSCPMPASRKHANNHEQILEEAVNNVRRNQTSKERAVIKRRSTPPAPLVKKRPQAMSPRPRVTVKRAPSSQLKKTIQRKMSLNITMPNIRLEKENLKITRLDPSLTKRHCPSPVIKKCPQSVKGVDLDRLKSTMEWVEKLTSQENCPFQRTDRRRFLQLKPPSSIPMPARSSQHMNIPNFTHYPKQSNPMIQPYRGHPGSFQPIPIVYPLFPPVYTGMTHVPFPQHSPIRY